MPAEQPRLDLKELRQAALLELEHAVAPRSLRLWDIVIEPTGQIRWICRKMQAYILKPGAAVFEVHKGHADDSRQIWRNVPTLGYALALGELG